ncbi:aryl-sulfate sulfotransferase [Bosea sp. PAMC 26642]|nr:aryl-sulfate sulfotransferase [Bosea sp. PAMC 26642]
MGRVSAERKRSLAIAGHRTSVSLEDPFWDALKQIAAADGRTMAALVAEVDSRRGATNLSSALRLHVLEHYRRLVEDL